MKPLAVLAALVASLALVAAGCGGDDEESAGADPTVEWAEGFCQAFSGWTNQIEELRGLLDDPTSVSLDSLRGAAEDASSATEQFVDEVRALGSPETESGDQIEQSIDLLADTFDEQRARIDESLADAEGIAGTATAVAAVATAVSAMASAFQTAFSNVEDLDTSGELESAFEQADACDEIAE